MAVARSLGAIHRFPAGLVRPAGLALGLFCIAAATALAAVGGVDLASLSVVIALPVLAAALSVVVVRACSLDSAAARWMLVAAPAPEQTARVMVECARRCRDHGPASLVEFVGGSDRLLSDGLRLVVARAEARLIRDALNRRLEASLAGTARTQGLLAGLARSGPILVLPVVAAIALTMARDGVDPSWSAASLTAWGTLAAMVAMPVLVLAGPVRAEIARRLAVRTLSGTIVIEGVAALRAGDDPATLEVRLCSMLWPPPPHARTAAA